MKLYYMIDLGTVRHVVVSTQWEKEVKHKCCPRRCRHCDEEIMDVKAPHQCYIQPIKQLTDECKVFDFETQYHNCRDKANFCYERDLDGKKLWPKLCGIICGPLLKRVIVNTHS